MLWSDSFKLPRGLTIAHSSTGIQKMAREVLAVNETSLFTQSSEDQADENSGCDDDDVESCDFLSNETQKSTSFLMQLTVGIGGLVNKAVGCLLMLTFPKAPGSLLHVLFPWPGRL